MTKSNRALGRYALAAAACAAAATACTDAATEPADSGKRARAALAFPTDPGPIQPLMWEEWASVSAGGDHGCAVTVAGNIYCWGSNAAGQLGSPGANSLRPRGVDFSASAGGYQRFQAVSAGDDHTCALSGSPGVVGYVYCWGSNIGSTPTPLSPGVSLIAVSVGKYEACGLSLLGYAYCWPLGGSPASVSTAPNSITFSSISVGHDHKCAVARYTELAFCWGDNAYGQLGINSNNSRSSPDTVIGHKWSGVDAGKLFTCGVQKAAPFVFPGAYCWGRGDRGQVGDALTIGSFDPEPVWDPPGSSLDVVSAGGRHACAIQLALNGHGDAWCWGDNTSYQLGSGNGPALISYPWPVPGDRVYSRISAGRDHSCAISRYTRAGNVAGATPSTAVIHCWGENGSGQLGNNSTVDSATPVSPIHPQIRVVVVAP